METVITNLCARQINTEVQGKFVHETAPDFIYITTSTKTYAYKVHYYYYYYYYYIGIVI
jgi:hypothetical protein